MVKIPSIKNEGDDSDGGHGEESGNESNSENSSRSSADESDDSSELDEGECERRRNDCIDTMGKFVNFICKNCVILCFFYLFQPILRNSFLS